MAFAPITIVAGPITATSIQQNLDKMRNYIDGGVAAADIATDGWVQAKHIVRGHYDPIVNMHTFVSGQNGGQTIVGDDLSFITDGATGRDGATSPDHDVYPETTIDFYLPSAADVLFQFSASPATPAMPTLNSYYSSRVYINLDGTPILSSRSLTTHYPSSVAGEPRKIPKMQNFWSGFYIAKNLSAGQHSIGLRGFTRARYSFLTKWSVSLEAFNR